MMSRKDGFLALLVVVVWGLNFVVIKVGLHHMPPLLLAGLRFLLVAFPAIFFVARPKVPLTLLLGYGLTISFGQFAFLFCAIKFGMPAGLASLVLQAQAFFTMALGAFVFSERLQRKQLAGIALAIIGVLVLIEASLNGQHIAMSGFMLTLAAAFSWACGNIFNKKIMQHSPRPAVMSLVVCDMLQGRLSAPRQRMLEVVRALCGVSDITYDATVARSEFEHSARNAAIAWLMKSFGNFHHDVPTVLQNYFHYCALKMSCMELARTFVFLANQGEAFHLDEPVVTPMQARQINALMATSGMYQNAGEFAWRVGLPAKSGVGGGIVAIVPHEMAIAVWSPELDPAGNSLAGIAALEQLTQTLGRSVY